MASAMRSESERESLIAFPSSCINIFKRSSKFAPFSVAKSLGGLCLLDASPDGNVTDSSATSVRTAPGARYDCSGPRNASQVLYRQKPTFHSVARAHREQTGLTSVQARRS